MLQSNFWGTTAPGTTAVSRALRKRDGGRQAAPRVRVCACLRAPAPDPRPAHTLWAFLARIHHHRVAACLASRTNPPTPRFAPASPPLRPPRSNSCRSTPPARPAGRTAPEANARLAGAPQEPIGAAPGTSQTSPSGQCGYVQQQLQYNLVHKHFSQKPSALPCGGLRCPCAALALPLRCPALPGAARRCPALPGAARRCVCVCVCV